MPRKIRELEADLRSAGFANRGGKGSHRNYEHAKGVNVTVAGQSGDDAPRYLEKDVKAAIKKSKE